MRKMIGFLKNEEGATALEYGLLAAIVAVALVAAFTSFAPKLSAAFTNMNASL